ncbi:MAG: hypothetical protein SFU56_07760 [Capsulimonadales bacterium]|nr:hypothetical protein [Capsulimonadales bacterium]
MNEQTQLIVYACPTGSLSERIEEYYARTERDFGRNKAHDYMPHITLTGFFRDDAAAIPRYVPALERAVFDLPSEPVVVTITGMLLLPDFIGLTIEAEDLRERIAGFSRLAVSPTRTEAIRLKDNLHVSLAYGFPETQFDALSGLATAMVDPTQPVAWDLRFYERRPGNEWLCHYSRPL